MNPRRTTQTCCLLILPLLLALPPFVYAKVEVSHLQAFNLDKEILDITSSFDGKTLFALTRGEIWLYSVPDKKIAERIAIDGPYDRIDYSQNDTLILAATDPPMMKVIRFDRIYDIDISNRPYKGPPAAKATLIVFDDYQ